MTRGNFLLITDTANWMSIQFNGDMYPSCNGKFVYHMLESVETYDDLAAAILKFDEERFGYADMHDIDLAPNSISDDIDFSKDYFTTYNSDYLYIKNASNKDCIIIAKNEVKQTIKPGEIQIWNYGNLVALDDKVLEELELDDNEKKFRKKRKNLHSTTDCGQFLRNATRFWRICQKDYPMKKKKSCRRLRCCGRL